MKEQLMERPVEMRDGDATVPDLQIRRVPDPASGPPEGPLGFGRVFTDHMLVVEHREGQGWGRPRIVPYGPLDLDPAASVLHYGQAMFEGMKAFRGADGRVRLFRAIDHCRRLEAGAGRLCMPAPPAPVLHALIRALVREDAAWVPDRPGSALYIRPTLLATEAFLGVRPARRYLMFVILSPVDPYYGEDLVPQRIWVEEELSRAAPGGLGAVKASGNYAASLLAARRAQERGYAQVLWLDAAEHRHVEELGMMNVFLKVGGALVTPPLAGTILGGITRDSIIRLARGWGMEVREEPVSLDDVRRDAASGRLEEVFGCGTAAVVAPVGELGTRSGPIVVASGAVGPVARRLYDAIGAIQRGTAPDLLGWTEALT